MTAEEARLIEGKFGRVTGTGLKFNHPISTVGRVVKVDSYYLYLAVGDDDNTPVLFSLRKITFEELKDELKREETVR